jgi:hypothetical protein
MKTIYSINEAKRSDEGGGMKRKPKKQQSDE